MAATSSPLAEIPWYRRRTSGWSYLALIPAKQLLSLYLAIFFLFSVFGFYHDLTSCGARAPVWAVLIVAIVNGLYADLYPYVLIHKPKFYLLPVILGSCLTGSAAATWLTYIAFHHPAHFSQRNSGMIFAGQGIMIAVVGSYICLVSFTRQQASSALRIQSELDLAHGIQRTLVPTLNESHSGYDLHGLSLPSEKVGGDLVDIVPLANGATLAYVADVSGHGLQAGILMGMVKTAVRTILLEDFSDPTLLLRTLCDRLNRALPGVKEAHMYATLSALYLDPDGTVFYTLAAHPAILHYHLATNSVTELTCEQFPVGLLPVSAYTSYSLTIAPGDILAITTDGILEACNDKDQEFGAAPIASLLQSANQDPEDPVALALTSSAILRAVQAYGKQSDDQTLLLIRRQARADASRSTAAA